MRDIVEIYKECGNFHQAVKESGLNPLRAHIALMKSGILKIQDKINYGSRNARLGGEAEKLFQELVPEAVDANKYWCKNNPVYDFMYKNMTIDIKYSSFHKKQKEGRGQYWNVRLAGKANLYVVFLENEKNIDKEKTLENPYILLIPNGFVNVKDTKNFTKKSIFFKDFQVEMSELKNMLDEYAGALI